MRIIILAAVIAAITFLPQVFGQKAKLIPGSSIICSASANAMVESPLQNLNCFSSFNPLLRIAECNGGKIVKTVSIRDGKETSENGGSKTTRTYWEKYVYVVSKEDLRIRTWHINGYIDIIKQGNDYFAQASNILTLMGDRIDDPLVLDIGISFAHESLPKQVSINPIVVARPEYLETWQVQKKDEGGGEEIPSPIKIWNDLPKLLVQTELIQKRPSK